jgi:hypothetical protein
MGQESQTSYLSYFLDIRQPIKGCRRPFLRGGFSQVDDPGEESSWDIEVFERVE